MTTKALAFSNAQLAIEGGEMVATGGTITITPGQESNRIRVGSNGIFVDKLNFTIAGFTSIGGCTQTAPVQGTIQGTCNKVSVGGKPTVMEGDTSELITIFGQQGQASCQFDVQVKVQDPGNRRIVIEVPDTP